MVINTMAGIFIVAILCGVGLGVASASSPDDAVEAGAFGYDDATTKVTSEVRSYTSAAPQPAVQFEQEALAVPSARTLDSGMKMVDGLERTAKERAAREDAEAIERVANQKAMQGVTSDDETAGAKGFTEEERLEYDLPAVDWTVGRTAFVDEWTKRIDKFLEGSNLEGYGRVFAEAAWDNGVDPRWSPAISNTESGKGSVCFLPHNAWGWGSSSWGDWESAIRDHVAGLAEVYGYSITYEAASIYCPPNKDFWYRTTITTMASI